MSLKESWDKFKDSVEATIDHIEEDFDESREKHDSDHADKLEAKVEEYQDKAVTNGEKMDAADKMKISKDLDHMKMDHDDKREDKDAQHAEKLDDKAAEYAKKAQEKAEEIEKLDPAKAEKYAAEAAKKAQEKTGNYADDFLDFVKENQEGPAGEYAE